jgi:hypothetical protein
MFRRFLLGLAWGILGVLLLALPSLADPYNAALCKANPSVSAGEICKVADMGEALAGMTSGMTDVAVLPMGLGAAMQTFRHIVLRNV